MAVRGGRVGVRTPPGCLGAWVVLLVQHTGNCRLAMAKGRGA